jgi:perosamine synthetase
MRSIPHNRPWITPEDRVTVDAVLASGWIAQGPAVADLEAAFVRLHAGGSACAVGSGTAALALTLHGLEIGPGMTVALPTYACSALLNAVNWVGARAEIVDVTPDSFVLDPAKLPATDAVVAVHAYGAPAPIAAYRARAGKVIEDCCQGVGGSIAGRPIGEAGDAAVYSFYATKILSGGYGGLVWSRAVQCIERVHDYRQFDGRDHYTPRFNFQLGDMQAALVLSQFSRLDAIRDRRAQLAQRYAEALPAGFGLQTGLWEPGRMVYRFVPIAPDRITRDALMAHLTAQGVACIVPVERFELLHRYLGLDPSIYPVAERLADTTLSLPLYPALSDAEADQICTALHGFQP